MKFHRRLKRSTKQYIIVSFICITVIGGAAAFTSFIITNQIKEEYEALLKEAHYTMEINQRDVYIAATDINAGEMIEVDNVKKETVYSSQPQTTYFTENQLGQIALVEIAAGTQILNTMVTEHTVSSKIREMEYDVIHINSNIISNDTVDVRIFYPNGESYVVLSKKVIKGIVQDSANIYLWLEEEEHLRMSAAIVDAALYPGSKLYITKYIEPNIQEASIVNYTPSLSILSLIENDPNIVERSSQKLNKEVRKALENRLATSMDLDISIIHWDVELNGEGNETISTEEITQEKDINHQNNDNISSEMELGTTDYFYYAKEELEKEGVVEHGE